MSSVLLFFFFKQKTAYEVRISDWSSDVCSSDLSAARGRVDAVRGERFLDRAADVGLAVDERAIAIEDREPVHQPRRRPRSPRRSLRTCLACALACAFLIARLGGGASSASRNASPSAGSKPSSPKQIGRATDRTPVTNAPLVCSPLREKQKN